MASKTAYYGSIVIIAMFVLSMFIVFLYSDSGTPTPSPSIEPTGSGALSFQGMGSGVAIVKGFGDLVLLSCQNSGSDLSDAISANSCVQNVFRASKDLYSVTLNPLNSSELVNECLFNLRVSIADSCQSTALRQAFLEFNSTVTFYDENQTQSLNVTPLEFTYYANTFSAFGFPGFVMPSTQVNSSIEVTVLSTIERGELANAFAQQTSLDGVIDSVRGVYVDATIVLYGDTGKVSWPISWEARTSVNATQVRNSLNESPSKLNLSSFDFTNNTLVKITSVEYSEENQSFLEKQDFINSVEYSNGEYGLSIKEGFSDKSKVEELAKKIDQTGFAQVTFPESAIVFTFVNNTNFSKSVEFVKSVVSQDAKIMIGAVVLLNATKASIDTGLIMPKMLQSGCYVNYALDQKTGREARLLVSAISRDKIPLQIDAVEE